MQAVRKLWLEAVRDEDPASLSTQCYAVRKVRVALNDVRNSEDSTPEDCQTAREILSAMDAAVASAVLYPQSADKGWAEDCVKSGIRQAFAVLGPRMFLLGLDEPMIPGAVAVGVAEPAVAY